LSSDYCKWFVCWGIASRPKGGRENEIAGYIFSTGLARWLAVELAEFGPVGEGEAGAKIAEGVVAGDEGHAGGESMGRYEHVHGREALALPPGEGGEAGIGLSSGRIPRQGGYSQEKLIN